MQRVQHSSRKEEGWLATSERGSRPALRFVVWSLRRLGAGPLRFLLAPIAAYYTVFASESRRASKSYLARVARLRGEERRPGLRDVYRHFYSFAEVMLDRLALWSGANDDFEIDLHGREHMEKLVTTRGSAVLVGAHLGGFDVLRVVARGAGIPVNVVMFTRHAKRINEAFEALDPTCRVRVIDLDPASARISFEIRSCLERGEFVAILADRLRPGPRSRTIRVGFLGGDAAFPQGPFLLPLLLRVPVILTLAVRTGPRRYDVFLEQIADDAPVDPELRSKVVRERVERFARRLESHCLRTPLQWFNFYDFWKEDGPGRS